MSDGRYYTCGFAFNPGEPSEIRTEDLDQFRFLGNTQAITIALAPLGWDIPQPDSGALASSTGLNRDDITPRDEVSVPGPQDFGTDEMGDDEGDHGG